MNRWKQVLDIFLLMLLVILVALAVLVNVAVGQEIHLPLFLDPVDEQVSRVSGAYVPVYAVYPQGQKGGSGFYISDDEILTVSHLLEHHVRLYTDKHHHWPAELLKFDAKLDVALLKGRKNPFKKIARLADKVSVYEPVFIVGSPVGRENVVTFGRVIGIGQDTLLVDARVMMGMSGAPIFSARTGEVVGMVKAAVGDGMNWFGLGIRADRIREFLK